jgi:glycosyltransferase involved in cell wall biosynthesis
MPTPQNPKIGYVVKRYPRYSETFIVNEILAHEATGMEIEIFALRPPSDTHFQDAISRVKAPVHYLNTQGVRIPEFWTAIEKAAKILPDIWSQLKYAKGEIPVEIFQAITLAKLAREKELGGLHAHFATSSTAVARLAAHLAGIPFTFTAHAKDIFHESIELADLDKKFKDAQAIVTVSDFNLKYLNQLLPQHKNKIIRIYNGLDLDRFQFEPESSKTNTIISVGRMVEKKGFIYLIQACEILIRTYPDFHSQIIGSGPEEEKSPGSDLKIKWN